MSLKRNFTELERYGLTTEEIKLGERFLRKNKTAGRIIEPESLKLFEMFLIGHTFQEINQQFPQYSVGQIVLTAALAGWMHDRDKMQYTLRDRVQAKVVKSVVEQVDFLTTLLSVNNAQHMDAMRKFISDPLNATPPALRIESIKEYREVIDALYKLIAGSTPNSKSQTSPLFNAFVPSGSRGGLEEEESNRKLPKTISPADQIALQLDEQNDADTKK